MHIFCSERICQVLNEVSEKCDGTGYCRAQDNNKRVCTILICPKDVCNEDPATPLVAVSVDSTVLETIFFYFILFQSVHILYENSSHS